MKPASRESRKPPRSQSPATPTGRRLQMASDGNEAALAEGPLDVKLWLRKSTPSCAQSTI